MNWKQLFFSITNSELIRSGISLFLFVTYIHELPSKYPCEKNLGPREKKYGPTKYEKKLRIHEIPTKEILDPQNTHEKKFDTHEIPTRKNFGTLKYPREKSSDPQKNFGLTKARWHYTHETHDSTRPIECSTLGCNPLRSMNPFLLGSSQPLFGMWR